MPSLNPRNSCVACALSALWGVFASTNARADAPTGDEVTVRGAKDTGGFVSRANVDDATREITDTASLLEPMAGVHVRRLGGDDSFASLSIRGSSSSEVAVILAGVPLTGGADPSLDLATLPLWPGAQARVYRSFAPGSLGPGSLGGTLVLDPPTTRAPLGTEVWSAVGSYGTARMRVANVSALDASNQTRLVTALSASRADDDFSYFDPTASTPGHDVYATRLNSRHAAVNGLTSLALPVRFGPKDDGTLTVTTLLQARRQEIPGTVLAPTPSQVLDSNRELASVALAMPSGRSGHGEWTVRAWGRRDDLRLRYPDATAALGPSHTDDAIVATGGALEWGGPIDDAQRASVQVHVDGSAERYAPSAWVGSPIPPGAERTSLGGAVDASYRATGAWTLTGTGRADVWNDASDDPSSPARVQARPTGHLGTELREGALTLSSHGGAVARAPSFVERYGDRGAFLGDPNLLPESAWTIDAGARVASDAREKVRGRVELAGFATWATDLIVFVPEGAYGRARATNIGRARILGLEAEAAASALGFELRASYTLLATANESECGAQTGSLSATAACDRPGLPGRPANDLVTDLTYTFAPLRFRYGVDAVSGMIADQVGAVVVPPRVLESAGVRLKVPHVRGLRLSFDARNLFNVRTATYDGALGPTREPIGDAYEYPIPGRTFLLSALWRSN
jgi:hypothetical protein